MRQAAAEGITLNTSLVVPRKGINKASYMEAFPLSQGKIPAIEGNGVKITETIAICYVSALSNIYIPPSRHLLTVVQYLSRLNPKSHLLGSGGTLAQEALVLQFVNFANQELLQTLARWFLPLIPGFTDPAPYNYNDIEMGKRRSLTLLDNLERVMTGVEWLVGDGPTLADVFIAVVLSRGFQYVLGRDWRDAHPACTAHFERVRKWEPVTQVIPEFCLVEEALPNVQPPPVQQQD